MIDFSRVPLWVYGHSFTADLSPTDDWEWMPKLAALLGSPSWRTFGVGSSRIADAYGDIAREAPTAPVADSQWPWNPPRRGAVVLQCETNDAICPEDNTTSTLPLNGKAVLNYQQTLEACLGLLAAEKRLDWNYPTGSSGTWGSSSSDMFLTGTNCWTDYVGAWREFATTVGSSGIIGLLTWDVSSSVSVPTVGAYQITVDGVAVSNQVARTNGWQNIWSRRGGGWLHNVGPRLVLVGGLSPGPHTVRVTKVDGPGRVYLDQLITLAAEPVPVLATKDPPMDPYGNHWAVTDPGHKANFDANRKNLHGAINRAVARFSNARAVSLSGIRHEHYAVDGIHLSPEGMDWQAAKLADALESLTSTYEPDLLYTAG